MLKLCCKLKLSYCRCVGNHAPIIFFFNFLGCSGESTVNAAGNLEEYATKEKNEKCFVRGNAVEMSG